MEAVAVGTKNTVNTDPRIFIPADEDEDINNKRKKALFMVVRKLDGNWEVVSIGTDPNTNRFPRVPKEWAGLNSEDLSKKITDFSVICKYGQLGFLEEKLPSDFRELPSHRFGLLDNDYEKLRIKDVISCDSSLLHVTCVSKKSAIRVAEIAADYLMTHN